MKHTTASEQVACPNCRANHWCSLFNRKFAPKKPKEKTPYDLVPVKRDGHTARISVGDWYRLTAKTDREIALLGYDVNSVRSAR